MSIESVAGAVGSAMEKVTAFIESVRKGPLLAGLLLLSGQYVYERMNSAAIAKQLTACQEERIKEKDSEKAIALDLADARARELRKTDSIRIMQADQITILKELLQSKKK